ncbi:uncharacterized protein AMSG_09109 [Thecamonas trahens ATCC 50062]|uniref:Peptidase A2 domain-containing protein n=1 Tax=Thecamonas trahens ATCC 50062 TaxID=461836 RepID=A0A0L0DLL9_THETB|nr:hypothetical protein AMSG_09109 [Thecamonas trahens ATCC 50062]KNC52941.1 hypothetical protein AMSG_09109 [Thecamonas trahens ATCC 50062]|eukprot:XP_013754836.1 hypothetical protein AMSG_09109 [Thecamonas trahens ATCC 50062]
MRAMVERSAPTERKDATGGMNRVKVVVMPARVATSWDRPAPPEVVALDEVVQIELRQRSRPFVAATIRKPGETEGLVIKMLVDTGASRTAIPRKVFESLGAQIVGTRTFTLGSGAKHERPIARVEIEIRGSVVKADVGVREGMSHGLVGIDWIMAVCPEFVYRT